MRRSHRWEGLGYLPLRGRYGHLYVVQKEIPPKRGCWFSRPLLQISLGLVRLQQFASYCINAHLLRAFIVPNVEGIAQAGTTLLPFEFLIDDFSGLSFDSKQSRLFDTNFCFSGQALTRVGEHIGCGVS